MSVKKVNKPRLTDTLNALDSAVDQWNSLTNKTEGEQAPADNKVADNAKALLKKLREQLEEFGVDPTEAKNESLPANNGKNQ